MVNCWSWVLASIQSAGAMTLKVPRMERSWLRGREVELRSNNSHVRRLAAMESVSVVLHAG
eukprot:4533282-Ditylum_brightwellii.AAC.1